MGKLQQEYSRVVTKYRSKVLASAKKISHQKLLEVARDYDMDVDSVESRGCYCNLAYRTRPLKNIAYYLPEDKVAQKDAKNLISLLEKMEWDNC